MNLSVLLNNLLPTSLWRLFRSCYYFFRHYVNSSRLPKGQRYFSLETKIQRLSSEQAISTLKTHFSRVEGLISQNKRLKVGFCVYSSSEWQCEKIYRFMDSDDRFEPVIVVCGLNSHNDELTFQTYQSTCRFFEQNERKYRLDYAGCDRHNRHESTLDEYDLLFYFQPSSNYLPEAVNFSYRLQRQLLVFILYGVKTPSGLDAFAYAHWMSIRRNRLGVDLQQIFWRHFCSNQAEYDLRKQMKVRAYNAVISGHPKLDDLLDKTFYVRPNLWKSAIHTRYKIIWAPHFAMGETHPGTFHENYQWFYSFAAAHPEICWIVRPHPRMLKGVLKAGVFDSVQSYDEYLRKWDELPNARVIPSGEYYDFFATSDAMITDSFSFRVEYLYTHKPLLLLLPAHTTACNNYNKELNFLGKCYYIAKGNDFARIQDFIQSDITNDPIKIFREIIYKQSLDIRAQFGMSSSEYIYKSICDGIWKPVLQNP